MEKDSYRNDKKDKEYFYRSSLNHFNNNGFDSLPPYLKADLNRQTNNEGIIFKGIYFFGTKSCNKISDKSKFIEFKKGCQIIHTWDSKEYVISVKEGKHQPVIKSCTPRLQR